MNRETAEKALATIERYLPYLRRHAAEYDQAPTPEHFNQAMATLRHFREAGRDIEAFLTARYRAPKDPTNGR